MAGLNFFNQYVKNWKEIGGLSASSDYLCDKVLKHINFKETNCIVELGAGDGSITKNILKRMKPDSTLIAFEVNAAFIETLNNIKDSRLHVIHDSAEHIEMHLSKYGFEKTDSVVTSIPYLTLPPELREGIGKAAYKALKKNGRFVQLQCSPMAKKMYKRIFGNVKVHTVIKNIPPAFIFVCDKK